MIPKQNCIFEYDSMKCKRHANESFQGIICEFHLFRIFGLRVVEYFSDRNSADVIVGPYLGLAPNIEFAPNTVVFPDRDFIDKTLGNVSRDDVESLVDTSNYKMSDITRSFLSDSSLRTHPVSQFQFEILRNMFVCDPSTGVNMTFQADETKATFRNEIQTRLNTMRTFVQNQNWYKYVKNGSLKVFKMDGSQKKPMASFEEFLMFNVHPDNMNYIVHTVEMNRLNVNLAYVDGVGYVTVKALYHPTHLTIWGQYKLDNLYHNYKTRFGLKDCNAKKRDGHSGDQQVITNLYDTGSFCVRKSR